MRFAWGLSILATLLAYGAVIAPAHMAVAALGQRARSLYDSANQNERLVAREPETAREERLVQHEIARLAGSGKPDSMLETLDRESIRDRIRVIAVTPGSVDSGSGKHDPLSAVAINIELEGSFSNLLALLKGLSDGRCLMGVDSLDLRLARSPTQGAPLLDATLGARLYSLPAEEETSR